MRIGANDRTRCWRIEILSDDCIVLNSPIDVKNVSLVFTRVRRSVRSIDAPLRVLHSDSAPSSLLAGRADTRLEGEADVERRNMGAARSSDVERDDDQMQDRRLANERMSIARVENEQMGNVGM
jgi:hypothetical protein